MMDEVREGKLKLNKRLMFGTRFFIELKSLNSVIQLFYLSRGLDLSQIVYLSLVWTITAFLFDVPSSYLGDKFGRKKMIIVGLLFSSLSTFLLLFANGFLFVTLAYVVGAIGYSFFMGLDQAVLYDSLKELGEEKNISKVSGKYFSAQSLPKVVMPLLGSLIAKDLLAFQFNILIMIDLIGILIAIFLASRLTEPKAEVEKVNKLNLLKEGFKLIAHDKVLMKFALNKIIVFQASFVYWRIYQVLLKNEGMPIIYLGLIYTVFQGIQFLLLWYTEKAQNLFGKVFFANIPAIVGVVAVIVSFFSSNLVVLFIACILLLLTGVSRDPFFMSQIQSRIHSFNRATTTSALNAIRNFTDIPLLLLIGYLAKIDINYVLVVSAILFTVSILFLRIKKEDLTI